MVFMHKEAFSTQIKIETLGPGDVNRALAFFASTGKPYNADDIAALTKGMASNDWTFVMAVADGTDIGGTYLNWSPKYHVYKRLQIPELQDLRVLPGHRRHGVGTALITACEELAKGQGSKGIGISVGLHAEYGNAQRLYVSLGYTPDGNGVTYDREVVEPNAKMPIDDDLALMMLKFF